MNDVVDIRSSGPLQAAVRDGYKLYKDLGPVFATAWINEYLPEQLHSQVIDEINKLVQQEQPKE